MSQPHKPHKLELWARAQHWSENGKRKEYLLGGWHYAVSSWWLASGGAKQDGVNDLIETYMEASRLNNADSVSLSKPDRCYTCGEWQCARDLAYCTHCLKGMCYPCYVGQEKHLNGNPACTCGGEMVT